MVPDSSDVPVLSFVPVSEMKEQRRMDSGEECLDALEEVFKRIQTVTGEDNLDMLVNRFIQGESPRCFLMTSFLHRHNASRCLLASSEETL